jgi:hypothetical protein
VVVLWYPGIATNYTDPNDWPFYFSADDVTWRVVNYLDPNSQRGHHLRLVEQTYWRQSCDSAEEHCQMARAWEDANCPSPIWPQILFDADPNSPDWGYSQAGDVMTLLNTEDPNQSLYRRQDTFFYGWGDPNSNPVPTIVDSVSLWANWCEPQP